MTSERTGVGGDTLNDLRDEELVRRCQAGATAAFDVLVLRHQEKVFNAVYRYCGDWDHACDVAQRAFLNAYRNLREFKGDAAFSTWIYRIAFNLSMSFRREQGRQKMVPLQREEEGGRIEPAVESDPGARMEADESRRLVRQALEELGESDRQIIVLKDLEDCSYEQIAEILGVPRGTVRSRLHRARLELREKLKRFMGTLPGGAASK